MKRRVDELALFGGERAFERPFHVGAPNLPSRRRFDALLDDIFARRWLTNNGPCVQELEARLAGVLEVEHAVAVSNGTAGLELVARALDLHGEVIVPAFTFVATAHAFDWLGLEPVFCDIDPQSHCLDPRRVEELITERTSAIVGVHVWGGACAVEALQEIAARHRLSLVFDAAHAFACTHRGKWIGGFGDAEVFSFHATKFFSTLEGGLVTTGDAALAQRLRRMRNFGFAGYDDVDSPGINAKMNEVSAAFGLAALDKLGEVTRRNRETYDAYRKGLAGCRGLCLFEHDERERRNYQYVVVELSPEAGLSRDTLCRLLGAENALARRYFYPGCHRMQPYARRHPRVAERLPVTERVCESVLSLPAGAVIATEAVERVCELIRFALDHADEIEGRYAVAASGAQ